MAEDKKGKESKEANNKEKRCFVMMPISDQGDYPSGHFDKVYNQIFQPAIKKAGYKPYRVDENTISDSIVNKIFEAIQNCEMALCDLSNRNPNVLYELGLRQAYNKPVVLVCDDKTDKIFDVSGISTVFYKSDRLYENVLEAQGQIHDALEATGEGKAATLVQVVHATEANYNSAPLDKDEKTDIMLRSILNEVRKLNISTDDTSTRGKTICIKSCLINVMNSRGLTLDQLKGIIAEFESIISTSIYFINGDYIELKIRCVDNNKIIQNIYDEIEKNIGEIVYTLDLKA